jgi:predicted nucleic-acid-binding protein
MNAADTNIVVRILTRDIAHQAEIADRFIEGGSWVSILVLAEAMWVLGTVYGSSHIEITQAVDMLLNHRDLVIQDADAVEAALDLFRSKPSLGFSDCLILQLARNAGHLPLATFDRSLAKVAGTHKL